MNADQPGNSLLNLRSSAFIGSLFMLFEYSWHCQFFSRDTTVTQASRRRLSGFGFN
jgi:hypothetical protein